MEKLKKITIKFFLNKNLHPVQLDYNGETPLLGYPLYIQVTYNRNNSQFKSHYGGYYSDLAKIDEENFSGAGLLAFEENIVRKVIEHEIKKRGDKFDLKGINKKYDLFSTSIEVLLNSNLKQRLFRILLKQKPAEYSAIFNFNDPKIDVLLLYKAASKLYESLEKNIPEDFKKEIKSYELFSLVNLKSKFTYSFSTIIDWLEGNAKVEFEKKLKNNVKTDLLLLPTYINIIDKQIAKACLEHE